MGAKSSIEWTSATWTPIRARNLATGKIGWHCEHVSPGCANCYAERFNKPRGTGLDFKPGHRGDIEIFLDEKMLLAPLRWKKPRMIFVCSMTDAFASFVKDEWLDRMFAVMALCPQHTFQVLTKRAERMREYMTDPDTGDGHINTYHRVLDLAERMIDGDRLSDFVAPPWPLPNVWLGVSAEDQANADERIPFLLQTPAAVRFVSLEPLLGAIDLYNGDPDPRLGGHKGTETYIGDWWPAGALKGTPSTHGLDWVITGGESGPDARPSHPVWFQSLRDQCEAADVAFFHKQNGEWIGDSQATPGPAITRAPFGSLAINGDFWRGKWPAHEKHHLAECMYRIGKKAAGRLLDGKEHNGMPSDDRTSFARTQVEPETNTRTAE